MTGKAVAWQGTLALAGLTAAYFTWQRQPELAQGEVVVVDVSKGDLDKVRFENPDTKVWTELIRQKDENGSFIAVRLSGSDASNVPLPSGHPTIATKVPERLVRGNNAANELFGRFTPLRASRALGAIDDAKAKDLGIATAKNKIELTTRGAARRFTIAPAPLGGTDPYLRDADDGRVYVVPRIILTDLQSASVNLAERRLHAFRVEEVDRVVVIAADKRKEFVGSRFENQPGIRLAPATASDKPDETARNWHERIWNLFPAEVLGADEAPTGGVPQVALRIEYSTRGRQLGWIELARGGTATAESTANATPSTIYARSEFTLGWFKLAADAAALVAEGEKLAKP